MPQATLIPAMLADILRQRDVLDTLYARRASFLALGRDLLRPRSGGRLFAFGCGDGWAAARAVAGVTPAGFGLRLEAATSLGMLVEPGLAPRAKDRAIAISMSGSVDRTNAAADAVTAAGGTCVALSNTDGGQLGQRVRAVAALEVHDIAPFLTGTSRYSATVLALMLLMAGAGSMPDALQPEIMQPILEADLPVALSEIDASCRVLAARLIADGLRGVRVLGAGTEWGTAEYGAAKLVKLFDGPVWAGEIEEYAHSQFWSARRDELVILLAGTPTAALIAENTASALAAAGMRSLAIEASGVAVPTASYRLTLPAMPPVLSPLFMPAPLQLFAYHLAIAAGKDPNVPQDEGDPDRFLAAQMLSRRCELTPAP
nr:SIS domain-containing protein [uncultured Lichenicoccus sp.]